MSVRDLPRSTPESEGIPSSAIEALVHAVNDENLGFHSLMILRHGKVVAETWWKPYESERPHMMFSVSKSFTATAIGLAQHEGWLSVTDSVLSFFPSYASRFVKQNVKDMEVRHLLSMATGHAVDTMEVMRSLPEEDWVKLFLNIPVEYPPGTHFLYNSGASFVLSAIIRSRTGIGLREYLESRLLLPMGMKDVPWECNPRGIEFGASGLRLRTEELAKFGQLYLQKGMWEGKQLLPQSWTEAATTSQVMNGTDSSSDWSQGYGYQFWRSRHNSYRADGRYGQFSMVLPEQDVVVAITAGTAESRRIPPLIWGHLLPQIHATALAENKADHRRLVSLLSCQEIPVPQFLPADPPGSKSLHSRQIVLPFNTLHVKTMTVTFEHDSIRLTTVDSDGRENVMMAGRNEWRAGKTTLWPYEEMNEVTIQSVAGWFSSSVLQVRQQCVDTPFMRLWQIECNSEDEVTVSVGLDNGFWAERTEVLNGHVERAPSE